MAETATILLAINEISDWGILTTDANLNVNGWNAWLEKSSERPAELIVGRNLLDVFPDLVTRRLDQLYREALSGKIVVLAQRLHGYLLPFPASVEESRLANMQQSARIAPLVENGQVVGTVTLIEDVTERVVNDRDLADQARQQKALAGLGQMALASTDVAALMEKTAVVAANTLNVEFSAVLELSKDGAQMQLQAGVGWRNEVIGRISVEATSNSHAGHTLASRQPVIIANLDSETRFSPLPVLKEHGVVCGISVPIIGADRPLGVISVYATRSRTFSDENIHFLQTAANILGIAIERRSLEAELVTRIELLAESDKRKDEFLAMLAHELRNPLAPLSNALHVVRMLDPNPVIEVADARNLMERQIEHMVRLVDDLLDVSRITRGKIELQKEPVDLAMVVTRAIESSRPLIDSRKHKLDVILPKETLSVDADPLRLAQVFWNLLNNAAKYTPEGGSITIAIQREMNPPNMPETAIIRVRDTGMGIPASMLGKVFDMFTQMDRTLDRADGGLGIGLTLVRRLVEMHDGTVQALSDGPGMGSEFIVRLPISVRRSETKPELQSAAKVAPTSGRRILVVDDNRDSAESIAVLLRLCGNDVRTTHDGRLAVEIASAYRPDVILLDIGLPKMNGLEVCRHLRLDPKVKNAIIVAMTGYGQEDDRIRSQKAGFDDHLVKPVDLQHLYEMLANPDLLDRKHIEMQPATPR